jgi:hypothetical protein
LSKPTIFPPQRRSNAPPAILSKPTIFPPQRRSNAPPAILTEPMIFPSNLHRLGNARATWKPPVAFRLH